MAKFTPATYAELPPEIRLVDMFSRRPWKTKALLGWARTPLGPVAVYNSEAIIEIEVNQADRECTAAVRAGNLAHEECRGLKPAERRQLHWEMVSESFSFNTEGAYIGPETPIFLPEECFKHEKSALTCPCPLSALDHWWPSRLAAAARAKPKH